MKTSAKRPRLSVDTSDAVIRSSRRTADRFFRGSLSDTVTAGLTILQWFVRQRLAGRRVVAVTEDQLPQTFEEPVIPALEQAMNDAMDDNWTWLVARPHAWRRQLWIKGRRLTAGDLARTLEIEGWDAERGAEEFELPVEAIEEAQRYLEAKRDLVLAEERENRLAVESAVEPVVAR